ncbi:MAG: ParB N-terminal domain-containing protein [Terracidiphilus sp.]
MTVQSKLVEVKNLLFDPHNPRLPGGFGEGERDIFRFLVDSIGIDDLLDSMASSGVIEGDPIIVRPAEATGQFYVIEGNRRLAALKLLNGEKIGDGKPEPSLPKVSPEIAESLKTVTVQYGWDDQKLDAYLGYKHVTATREWPPEAKARFVLDKSKGDLSTDNLQRFAKRLGTTLPTLRRWLIAYLTLKQAEKIGIFDPAQAPRKRYFGTFYTLLGSREVQKFLALSSEQLTETPVPQDHIAELGEFISWTIGTTKAPPFVNSRSQQELDAVLASPNGLQHFRNKKNLDAALLYTEYNSGEITAKLLSAAYTIEECLTKIFDVKDDPKVVAAIENLEGAMEKLRVNTVETKTGASR